MTQHAMNKPKSKILLVDDELSITDNLEPILQRSGFDVQIAADGLEALEQVDLFSPNLIILDVDMPHMDGRAVLRHLRYENNWVPIILLTKIGESAERTMALEEGADDYLKKPFEVHELVARVKAVLRRTQSGRVTLAASPKLVSDSLQIDRASRNVTLSGKRIHLTAKAVSLLEYFMVHPGEAITRERLLNAIWGWTHPVATRTIDTRIGEVRKALGDDPASPNYIETVPGHGYRFIGEVRSA